VPAERHERNGRSQQLEKTHEETKSALHRKEEEHTCLKRAQAETRREREETLLLIQVQVTEMYEQNKELKTNTSSSFRNLYGWKEKDPTISFLGHARMHWA